MRHRGKKPQHIGGICKVAPDWSYLSQQWTNRFCFLSRRAIWYFHSPFCSIQTFSQALCTVWASLLKRESSLVRKSLPHTLSYKLPSHLLESHQLCPQRAYAPLMSSLSLCLRVQPFVLHAPKTVLCQYQWLWDVREALLLISIRHPLEPTSRQKYRKDRCHCLNFSPLRLLPTAPLAKPHALAQL